MWADRGAAGARGPSVGGIGTRTYRPWAPRFGVVKLPRFANRHDDSTVLRSGGEQVTGIQTVKFTAAWRSRDDHALAYTDLCWQ